MANLAGKNCLEIGCHFSLAGDDQKTREVNTTSCNVAYSTSFKVFRWEVAYTELRDQNLKLNVKSKESSHMDENSETE